jgi:glycosyltransferase involved in cell wall biosynthesis
VPAVVSPDVQLAPWIAERRFGAVVDRQPAALAEAILAVLDDTALRTRVAEHGAEAVVADFGVTRVAPALGAMYDSAIQRCSS